MASNQRDVLLGCAANLNSASCHSMGLLRRHTRRPVSSRLTIGNVVSSAHCRSPISLDMAFGTASITAIPHLAPGLDHLVQLDLTSVQCREHWRQHNDSPCVDQLSRLCSSRLAHAVDHVSAISLFSLKKDGLLRSVSADRFSLL